MTPRDASYLGFTSPLFLGMQLHTFFPFVVATAF